jgi:RimJ/RimL family protein N-acetyltransferase
MASLRGAAGAGGRVVLRELRPDDLPALEEFWTPAVYRWLPELLQSDDRRDLSVYLVRSLAEAREVPRTKFQLVAEVSGRLVGTGSVAVRDEHNASGEIGYALREDIWNRGYGTELAKALIETGFATLGMHRVWATVHPQNVASIRVLEKAGMTYEGRLRDHLRMPGGWRDSLLYAVLGGDQPGPPPAAAGI